LFHWHIPIRAGVGEGTVVSVGTGVRVSVGIGVNVKVGIGVIVGVGTHGPGVTTNTTGFENVGVIAGGTGLMKADAVYDPGAK
jgi:hypothetical protein